MATKKEIKKVLDFLESIRGGSYDVEMFKAKLESNLPKEAFRQDGHLYSVWENTIDDYITDLRRAVRYREGKPLGIDDIKI